MKLVLLGAPGAGKGTQAKKLMERYSIPEISTGEILRKAVADGAPLGRDAKGYMDRGELVPDSIVLGLVHARLRKGDCGKGFVIYGFPRNEVQALSLDKTLSTIGCQLSLVVSIDLDKKELMNRMSGRRICRNCGRVYNIYLLPPSKETLCDECGGALYQREDDRADTIRKRLDVYESLARPVIQYYSSRGLLKSITGSGSPEEIFEKICKAV